MKEDYRLIYVGHVKKYLMNIPLSVKSIICGFKLN